MIVTQARKGPPIKHDRGKLIQKLNEYIDHADVPIIAEFCYQHGIRRQNLYDIATTNQELDDSIKRCIEKKEAQLEKKALAGEVNPIFAIFSLKQLGWTDRQEVHTTTTSKYDITIEAKLLQDSESAELIRKLYQRQQAIEIADDE